MLALNASILKRLVGVIKRLTRDRSLREDLMQEAMIHFWKQERERPGQTLSWYLQGCYFHLRHCLRSGRSIDSSRRRNLQVELPKDEDLCDCLEWPPIVQSVLAEVEVRESMRLLRRHLSPRERAILLCLAEGLRPREIARQLLLSHPTVNKGRRKIADTAIRLGIGPPAGVAATGNGSAQVSKALGKSPHAAHRGAIRLNAKLSAVRCADFRRLTPAQADGDSSGQRH